MCSKEKWNELFSYDDGFLYWKINANNNGARIGDLAGFISNPGEVDSYAQVRYEGVAYQMSVIIWEMHNGEVPAGMDVDHIDGNRLNNVLQNLRLATRSQNLQNRGKHNVGFVPQSKYKGVSRATGGIGWRAAIYPEGKTVWLGRFKTAKEAAIAYNKAAVEYYGEFAKLNVITETGVI